MTRSPLVLAAVIAVALLGCKRRAGEAGPDAAPRDAGDGAGAVRKGAPGEQPPDRVELSEEALEQMRLAFYEVKERELAPGLEVAAELVPDPDRRADVGSRTSGRVVEFRVKVGDRVERGGPVVVLESQEVGRARAGLTAAAARADVARAAAAREEALLEARATSRKDREEAEGARRAAEAELAAARTLLATLGAGEQDDAGGARSPGRLVVRSPIRGTVVARTAHPGQSVAPTDTLAQVVDLDVLWLEAQVHEREMRFVAAGQPVRVEARAFPGEVFQGEVERIGETLDPKTRAVSVRVSLPNPEHRLKPGMFATARIAATRARAARPMLAVPWAAVQEIDGHPSVFVRAGERAFELRRVHTGERAGDLVEVLNGVDAGDVVVAAGSFLLKGELLKSTLGGEE